MEKVTLFIPLDMPGFNQVTELAKKQKRGYSPYNIMKRQLTKDIGLIVRSQFKEQLEGRYEFKFIWERKYRRLDPDNICFAKKFIMDGLVESGIMSDDRWKQVGGFADRFRKTGLDGVVIEISEYVEEEYTPDQELQTWIDKIQKGNRYE